MQIILNLLFICIYDFRFSVIVWKYIFAFPHQIHILTTYMTHTKPKSIELCTFLMLTFQNVNKVCIYFYYHLFSNFFLYTYLTRISSPNFSTFVLCNSMLIIRSIYYKKLIDLVMFIYNNYRI